MQLGRNRFVFRAIASVSEVCIQGYRLSVQRAKIGLYSGLSTQCSEGRNRFVFRAIDSVSEGRNRFVFRAIDSVSEGRNRVVFRAIDSVLRGPK